MIADCLEDMLVHAGFSVCGIAGTVETAIEMGLRCSPDFAVIDLRLADHGLGVEVAAVLHHTMGVLYASGNPDSPLLLGAPGDGCISKPYSAESMIAALRIVQQMVAHAPLSAFPHGFRSLH